MVIGVIAVLATSSGSDPLESEVAEGSGTGDLIIITEPDAPSDVTIARQDEVVENLVERHESGTGRSLSGELPR